MSDVKPAVWQMIKEAAESLGGQTTNKEIKQWIQRRYPGTNQGTINCQILASTVNRQSRTRWPHNQHPRVANTQYDFLFSSGRGSLELYDPQKHGQWQIRKAENGDLEVCPVGECVGEDEDAQAISAETDGRDTGQSLEAQEPVSGFAYEAHLRDYLAGNIHLVENGLQLYVDDTGTDGVEYQTDVGRIDLLGLDHNDGFVVVELKIGRGPDAVAGQVMRYMGWVKRHLAAGRRVRGFIIAEHISDRLRYATADLGDVFLKEYELNLTLKDVAEL